MRYQLMALLWLISVAAGATPSDAVNCLTSKDEVTLGNSQLQLSWKTSAKSLTYKALDNFLNQTHTDLNGELFELQSADGATIRASELQLVAPPVCTATQGSPEASRRSMQLAAKVVSATFSTQDQRLRVVWTARLTPHSAYVRQSLNFTATQDLSLPKITLISMALPQAMVSGTTDGAPIVTADSFFAFEHPMAHAMVTGGQATMTLRRKLPLRAGVPVEYASIVGVTVPGQMRRGFNEYLEAERAHPFRTFLHYNSWYDIGYFSRYTEAEALNVVTRYGQELVSHRGVVLDSFLFDDGWDDTQRLWTFNAAFPDGFKNIAKATARIGAAPGLWLSPWGGYGPPRQERLKSAQNSGFEVDDQGIALSGPRYYAYFSQAMHDLLSQASINQFKVDGIGSPDKVTPGSAFDSDFAAAITLIDDLRLEKPDLYINLTTGTWPSPFWLRTADSIWRGGEDHEFAGSGTDRQRWITYRDADTYGGIVRQCPLFPLNSLMLHGIIYASHAKGLNTDPQGDFDTEVWSYFASGTGLQELYVSPELMTPKNWDLLAKAANWARARAPILKDSHWLGGDPARDNVYGWASWNPTGAVLALRNPSTRRQTFSLHLDEALELPKSASRRFKIHSVTGATPAAMLNANQVMDVTLAPHGLIVWDLEPQIPQRVTTTR